MKPEDIQKLLREVSKISDNSIDMMELLSAALVAVAQLSQKKDSSPEEAARGIAMIVYEKMILSQLVTVLLESGASGDEIHKATEEALQKIDNEIPDWLK
jgi:replicative DNA helicase